jgi:uncharacterized protein (TIRG00374 family)
VLGMVAVCVYRPLGESLLRWIARWRRAEPIARKLEEAYEALYALTRPAKLAAATLVATGAWGLECVALHVIVRGFPDGQLAWEASTFAYAASTIAGALAMMPGGLGITEVGMTGLLQILGAPSLSAASATAVTLLVRLATLWFAVVLGLAALGVWRALRRRDARAAASRPGH